VIVRPLLILAALEGIKAHHFDPVELPVFHFTQLNFASLGEDAHLFFALAGRVIVVAVHVLSPVISAQLVVVRDLPLVARGDAPASVIVRATSRHVAQCCARQQVGLNGRILQRFRFGLIPALTQPRVKPLAYVIASFRSVGGEHFVFADAFVD